MGLLKGQKAIVTGGASGIGEATCRRMAEEGARVAVLDVNAQGARAVAEEIGGVAFAADVGDPDGLRSIVDLAVTELEGLSVLYNNAGVGDPAHRLGPGQLGSHPPGEPDRCLRRFPCSGAPPSGQRGRVGGEHGVHQRDEAGRR